ncbi:28S ribosomal protein S5, mitochondrial-like [Tachysurus fulvidraco]|nr:28S ribosomal protein S5, mitochondrial-like [Tachysurus fulvidraco]
MYILDRHIIAVLLVKFGSFSGLKMAAAARLCVLRVSLGGVRTLGGSGLFCSVTRSSGTPVCSVAAAVVSPAAWDQTRHSSFFNKLTADELWRGVLAESGAGSRKGRGKRTKRKLKKDLNRGQNIGEGRDGFLWPGLNVPIIKAGTIQSFSKRGEVEQQELRAELERQRDEWDRKRKMKIKRERGWSGNCWGGISLGHPDPGPNGETYEDFDCRVIEVSE